MYRLVIVMLLLCNNSHCLVVNKKYLLSSHKYGAWLSSQRLCSLHRPMFWGVFVLADPALIQLGDRRSAP